MPTGVAFGRFFVAVERRDHGQRQTVQLYNPYSLNTTTGLRAPFPDNMMPASQFSPAAVKLLEQFVAVSGAAAQHRSRPANYFYGTSSQLNMDQGDIKLDWRPEDKDYFSFRYSRGRQDAPGLNTFPLFYNSFNTSPFQNGVLNWTRTFKSESDQ